MFRSEIVFVEFVFLIWKVLDAFWYAKQIRRENAQEDIWKWLNGTEMVQKRPFTKTPRIRNPLVLLVWQGSSVG